MISKIFRSILPILLFLMARLLLAGPIDPPIEDDPVDPVPIDNWWPLLFLFGIGLAIIHLNKRKILKD